MAACEYKVFSGREEVTQGSWRGRDNERPWWIDAARYLRAVTAAAAASKWNSGRGLQREHNAPNFLRAPKEKFQQKKKTKAN